MSFVIEGQRQMIQQRRQAVLTGATASSAELERLVTLATIDDLWSEHLASVTELRQGIQWRHLGGRDPLHEYLVETHRQFGRLQTAIAQEIPIRLAEAQESGNDPTRRGATWTYLTTDQPFGNLTERVWRSLLDHYLAPGKTPRARMGAAAMLALLVALIPMHPGAIALWPVLKRFQHKVSQKIKERNAARARSDE